MRLKLTLERQDGPASDIVVEADPQTSVSHVARWVATRQGIDRADLSLAVRRDDMTYALASDTLLADTGLRSGDSIALVEATTPSRPPAPAATVRVVAGPETGMSVRLPPGYIDIGRDPSCGIRLTDPMVSQRHARLVVSDRVEVIDNGSSNGVAVDGEFVSSAVVGSGNEITLGGTTLLVHTEDDGWSAARAGVVPFNRSPWLDPRYPGVKLVAPEPPQPPQPHRFPIAMVLMPIALAAVLYLITQSAAMIAFVALSPLLMLGSWFENRASSKKVWEAAVQGFHDSMADLVVRMQRAMEEEQSGRRREHPSAEEAVSAAMSLHPMLWCRRADRPSFLDVRLGLGTQLSRNEIEIPSTRNTTPELWAELNDVTARFASVERVPVVGSLAAVGSIGVAGGDPTRLDAARGLMAQFAALHSPADLTIAAIVPPVASPDWSWLKWLPHVDSEHSPLLAPHLASSSPAAAAIVAGLDDLISARSVNDPDTRPTGAAVVLLIDEEAPFDRARLVDLAERGPAAGVFTVWLGRDRSRLPSVCRNFLEVDPQTLQPGAGTVIDGSYVAPVDAGLLSAAAANAFARALAPVSDAGALLDAAADLPSTVSFVGEQGIEVMRDTSAVVERWRQSASISAEEVEERRQERSLRAYVGTSVTGPLMLDLRAHGPHALVGGTTGSGKSEFLQTWLLGMALAYSPERVNFLLVDYKGGAAFGECAALPHSVGLVTDLNNRLVRRALTSLRSELKRREHILQEWRAKDLVDLESKEPEGAPVVPSLVIVVDEFAALVQEIPEFVDGMIDIAQRGRSLGLHLVLATQRPSGVIKGNLRANTNLRIALRMADEDDSHDVVGTVAAARFQPDTPGRAVAKLGPGKLVPFQAGYVGGWTTNEPPEPKVQVRNLNFGPGAPWDPPPSNGRGARDLGQKDIQRLCTSVGSAFSELGMAPPRRPWLPELADRYELSRLPTSRLDSELVIAVRDDPEHQSQVPAAFEPDRDGNLLGFGATGTGRSTFLRTVAVSAGFSVKEGRCAVYGLDFASRGLAMLEPLPHVGAVIDAEDDERVARLIRTFRQIVDERSRRFAEVKAGTIVEFRTLANVPDELRVIILVDGLGAFAAAYDTVARRDLFDQFQAIAQEGRAVGVHIVATADRVNSVGASLMSAFPARLAFRVNDELDHGTLGIPRDAFDDTSPPGRAYFRSTEVQVAVLGGDDATVASQAEAITLLARSMERGGAVPVPQIERLRTRVALDELPVIAGMAVFGLSDETLGPIGLKPEGLVVLTGPAGSGRTTCLNTVAEAVRRAKPGVQAVYLGVRRSGVEFDGGWTRQASGDEAVARLAEALCQEIDDDTLVEQLFVVEALEEFVNGEADFALQQLFRRARSAGVCVLVDGEISLMSQGYGIAKEARASRQSIVLQPDATELESISGFPSGRLDASTFPPGRGFLCAQSGRTRVQVAMR